MVITFQMDVIICDIQHLIFVILIDLSSPLLQPLHYYLAFKAKLCLSGCHILVRSSLDDVRRVEESIKWLIGWMVELLYQFLMVLIQFLEGLANPTGT